MRRLLLLALLLPSCGRGGSTPQPTAPTPAPTPTLRSVQGLWQGTVASGQSGSGTVRMAVTQSGASFTGAFCGKGSACLTQGTLSGTTSADSVTFSASFPSAPLVTFSGAVNSQATGMSGTYAAGGGTCSGDSGNWNVVRTASDPAQGVACVVCSADEQCACPLSCNRFSDGTSRCSSGLGSTTCPVP